MAGRHRRRRKTIAVVTLAILALIAVGLFLGQAQAASLSDFIWLNDVPAATNALPGQGA
jgi:hypothetical protein